MKVLRNKWVFKTPNAICLHTAFLKKANQIKTLEVIEESVIPSNNDSFLNWSGNHIAVEAINTFKE